MTKATIQDVLDKNKIMVIDGSMATALEGLGANTNSSLWTAAALAEQPELVKQVHLDYFRAGADCGITNADHIRQVAEIRDRFVAMDAKSVTYKGL